MFPIIDTQGSAHERGRVHGVAARARIGHSIATYARQFAYCGINWSGAQQRATGYRDIIGNLDMELLEEIEGIAAGSGYAVNEILALNARTEILPPSYPGDPSPAWAATERANRDAGVPDWGECTALAVQPARSATGTTLLAQNWDWIGAQRAAVILLRIRETDGRRALAFTEAGMLAKIGLNEAGFGMCLNLMRSTDDGSRPGVPVHVLLRALLKRPSVAEAIGLAASVTHGGSSNVLVADRAGDAASLELSPRGVEVIHAADGTVCHTNHFLCPAGALGQAPIPANLATEQRYARIQSLVAAAPKKIALDDVKAMLRDESDGLLSICRHPDPAKPREARVETVGSVIMDLATGVMHVAPDVPSKTEYRPVPIAARIAA